jgi:hypothetical protein
VTPGAPLPLGLEAPPVAEARTDTSLVLTFGATRAASATIEWGAVSGTLDRRLDLTTVGRSFRATLTQLSGGMVFAKVTLTSAIGETIDSGEMPFSLGSADATAPALSAAPVLTLLEGLGLDVAFTAGEAVAVLAAYGPAGTPPVWVTLDERFAASGALSLTGPMTRGVLYDVTLTLIDASGNRTTTTVQAIIPKESNGGCGCYAFESTSPTPGALTMFALAMLGLALVRRWASVRPVTA